MKKRNPKKTIFNYEDIPIGFYDKIYKRKKGIQSKWHHIHYNLVKKIPQKAWIRYISKKDMIVNKGGMLLKNNASNEKDKFLLLKSPSGPMWRVYTNEHYIYVDKNR